VQHVLTTSPVPVLLLPVGAATATAAPLRGPRRG
jgi:hypothetical protein